MRGSKLDRASLLVLRGRMAGSRTDARVKIVCTRLSYSSSGRLIRWLVVCAVLQLFQEIVEVDQIALGAKIRHGK